jgi:hypothetical protein
LLGAKPRKRQVDKKYIVPETFPPFWLLFLDRLALYVEPLRSTLPTYDSSGSSGLIGPPVALVFADILLWVVLATALNPATKMPAINLLESSDNL